MKKQSSFDKLKKVSKYHFDNRVVDKKQDVYFELGRVDTDFSREVRKIVADSKPANWETRGFKGCLLYTSPSPRD